MSVESETTREALLAAIDKEEPDMTLQANELSIPTTIPSYNRMMSPTGDENHPLAGIPRKTGIGIAGRPQSGKTTSCFQLMYEVFRDSDSDEEQSNGLIVDTEGSIHTYYGWKETFDTRYGMDTEIVPVTPQFSNATVQKFEYERKPEAEHQVFLMDVRDLTRILTLHGRPAQIGTEDGKMKLQPNGDFPDDIRDTPMGQFVFQNNIDVITYDSVTNPLETFTNRQQDRPTRAKATAWWMLQAQALAEARDMVQFYIAHLSKNPTNPYDRPDIIGGKNLKHQIKFAIYMRQDGETERAMKLFRHPSKQQWDDEWYMDLQTGKGFVDVND
jgi:hypothetical protein